MWRNNYYSHTYKEAMIIYNPSSIKFSRAKNNKYQKHFGDGYNQSRSAKVKTSSKNHSKVKKFKLNKKNIKYLKSLGFKVIVKQ